MNIHFLSAARAFHCQCGRPVFFRNSECLACHTPLGYSPARGLVLPLAAAGQPGLWREFNAGPDAPAYRRCSQLEGASACNWLIDPADDGAGPNCHCRSCRLTRVVPDLSIQENALWWKRIEMAKRRLVSALIALGLPVHGKVVDDDRDGLAFDFLRAAQDGPRVTTGHADGVITIDVEEADDAVREQRRGALHEPYRTMLGHLRHESGHYYWQRLVEGGPWLEPFRALFGDERQDYAAALQQHYQQGPPADWGERFVSAYASSHPWEDWAESWAHYLHMVDTLETARSFGVDGADVELNYEPFGDEVLSEAFKPSGDGFLRMLNSWMQLTCVLNELSRSMGLPDLYPFVLSRAAASKLHFIDGVVKEAAARDSSPLKEAA